MRANRFHVYIKGRRRYFATLADAIAFANAVHRRSGVILGIEECAA